MSYHIEINEYQRRLIMKALTSTDVMGRRSSMAS